MTTLCRCGTPTRDNASLCDPHASQLTQALAEVPFLAEQLEISRTRQRASGGTAGSGDNTVPWDEKASQAIQALHATLHTWVRFCDEEHIPHQSPNRDLPADDDKAMSRWLMWRVDGLTLHELGPDAWEEITNSTADARRVVFRKPKPKVYLGACTVTLNHVECGHAVYANQGDLNGRCVSPDCRTEYPVKESHARLLKALDDRLLTAADVATTATYMDLPVARDRIRKQINTWHKRGRLTTHGTDENNDPLFNFGTVRGLLEETYRTAEGESIGA